MQKEYDALIKNGTWKLVDPPLGTKPISYKWVYKNKYKVDGSLDKHKAMLVEKGFAQKEGVDYEETFSPTTRWATIRTLFALTAQNGNNESYIASIKKELKKGFEMTNLGYVHYYLGIEVTQHHKSIFLSQRKYIGDLLNRFMQKPCGGHWSAGKRALRYLKGTQDFGIKYTEVDDFSLIGYSDSGFDGDKETGVCTPGYSMSLGSRYVSWRSHKQSVPADSTTEAEYVAAAEETKEILWLRNFFEDLQVKQVQSTPFMIENTTIKLAKNPKFHDRTKNINTKYHLIQHNVDAKTIHLRHYSTNEQIEDIFIKALGREKLERFRTMLGLTNVPSD
eukprot:PITA_25951